MFSANAAELNKKVHSLKYQIKECNAALFTIEETNFKKKKDFILKNLKYLKQSDKTKKIEDVCWSRF